MRYKYIACHSFDIWVAVMRYEIKTVYKNTLDSLPLELLPNTDFVMFWYSHFLKGASFKYHLKKIIADLEINSAIT